MPIDKTKITKEMLEKALKCETADELVALAKAEGFTLTKEEAEAYLSEMDNMELDEEALDKVAGGKKICYAVDGCGYKN
ncbi:MAG: Nif11-like leader peptide family RiPP precursor [Spirochaetia bacterium]|nr:Nif11-like leader peptide family RiPP precursor [Spirochaetia bacterium]